MPYTIVQPAEQLMGMLATAGIGAVGDGSGDLPRLGIGTMPDTPDVQIALYDSPGQPPDPRWLLDYPYVQVMTRGAQFGYKQAAMLARQAYDVLLGIVPVTFANGDRLDGITGIGTPSYIGTDQNSRPIFSCNFRLIFEPAKSDLSNRQPL
jgi:hypothetical protein